MEHFGKSSYQQKISIIDFWLGFKSASGYYGHLLHVPSWLEPDMLYVQGKH